MLRTEIAQWIDAIGSLGAALVALFVVLYFEVYVANRKRREERSALVKAAMDEALLNEDFARHNARKAATGLGGVFVDQRVSSCIQAFHTGTFDIDDDTRAVVNGYIKVVEQVNSMIQALRSTLFYRPGDSASLDELRTTIKRYCGGEMDPKIDGDAKSLPGQIKEFRNELAAKFKKELM